MGQLDPQDDLVERVHEIGHGNLASTTACRQDRGFVNQVGQIRARESGCLTRENLEVHVRAYWLSSTMDAENLHPARAIRQADRHLPIEAARAQERGV